jgi:hypothetical protein
VRDSVGDDYSNNVDTWHGPASVALHMVQMGICTFLAAVHFARHTMLTQLKWWQERYPEYTFKQALAIMSHPSSQPLDGLKFYGLMCVVIVSDKQLIARASFVVFAALAAAVSSEFSVFNLLQVAFAFRGLVDVFRVITLHGGQLLLTVLLWAIIVWMYAVWGYEIVSSDPDTFVTGFNSQQWCSTSGHCFFNIMSLLASGEIATITRIPNRNTHGSWSQYLHVWMCAIRTTRAARLWRSHS